MEQPGVPEKLKKTVESLGKEWRKDENSDRGLRIEVAHGKLTAENYLFSKKLVSAYALRKFFRMNSRYLIDYEVVLFHSGKEYVFEKNNERSFLQFLSTLTPTIDPLDFQTKINQPQKCYH